ncbi:MAG: RNA methyltransferase [Deltaproteobacteria bacterium]|nr:RNA methyltransferase [Deltaproteobacteria bacterium]
MPDRVCLALVHHPTVDRVGTVVTTAVTTLDLHDFCRLARTYGLGGVYATTPLTAQRDLVASLLDHWLTGRGGEANPCRRQALQGLRVVESIDEAARDVAGRWGDEPELVATSARGGGQRVSFDEGRRRLASAERPVLLVFGTGWGLAPEALARCRWTLEPIQGPGEYNHLSVRSAASIVVDRLFGR